MALLASICLGLLLLVGATLIAPSIARAADAPQAPAGRPATGPGKAAPAGAERQRADGWVPGAGQASSPYDRQALRNFDAGSHR
jgi:hypothetical protein